MSDDDFLKHFQSLVAGSDENAAAILDLLINETVAYRDKLKKETGIILTVEDTGVALNALDAHLKGEPPLKLNDVQQTLFGLWLKRLKSLRREGEGNG